MYNESDIRSLKGDIQKLVRASSGEYVSEYICPWDDSRLDFNKMQVDALRFSLRILDICSSLLEK